RLPLGHDVVEGNRRRAAGASRTWARRSARRRLAAVERLPYHRIAVSAWRRLLRRLRRARDAVARWARMPPRPGAPRRRLVVVQVCGLSHDVLERALAQGRMRRVARLLRQGRFRLHRVPASLPTSTPAYQAAVMYGGPVDVPAFEFVDKRTGTYRWLPRPRDA